MAEIFNAPKGIKVPSLSGITSKNVNEKFKELETDTEKYKKDLKQYLQDNGYNGKNVGEVLNFPVADGHAQYMVLSMQPLRLVHLELGDAWSFQYANLLTAEEVQQKIDQQNNMKELFG